MAEGSSQCGWLRPFLLRSCRSLVTTGLAAVGRISAYCTAQRKVRFRVPPNVIAAVQGPQRHTRSETVHPGLKIAHTGTAGCLNYDPLPTQSARSHHRNSETHPPPSR